MKISIDDSHHVVLGPADDGLHPPTSHRWFHETVWFWWFVPERKIGGWLYNWVRPNIGTSGGGAWIWDHTTFCHMEVPYYACYSNLRFDPDAYCGDWMFPSGVSVQVIEPLRRYGIAYADGDDLSIDLEFAAVMPPWVGGVSGDPPLASHLDQVGRVTGSVVLEGETFDVDCLAIRDRSWAARSERWSAGQIGYCNACNEDLAFLAQCPTGASVEGGYFVKDGHRAALVEGSRVVERDTHYGFLRRVVVEATDTAGRRLSAVGTPISRMAMPIPGVQGVVWTSLVDWTVEGHQAWGEDQDAWALRSWSAYRRSELEGAR